MNNLYKLNPESLYKYPKSVAITWNEIQNSPGYEVPTQTNVRSKIGRCPTTVSKAYSALVQEKLIVKINNKKYKKVMPTRTIIG